MESFLIISTFIALIYTINHYFRKNENGRDAEKIILGVSEDSNRLSWD